MKGINTPDKKKFIISVTVGEKGQIVIPKIGRDMFNIKPGDTLMILGDIDKGGMAIMKDYEIYENLNFGGKKNE